MSATKPRQKKCRMCATYFHPHNSMVAWCSPDCGYLLAQEKLRQKERKEKLAKKRERNAIKKQFRENDKTYVARQAKAYLHRWIKWRDHKSGICFCCRKSMAHLPSRAIHAMHFRPSGMNSAVRYNEDNLRLGCYSCNTMLSGNLTEYEKYLIEDIGQERVEWLKSQTQVKSWTIEELRAIRDDYKQRLKDLDIPLPRINK